MWNTTQTTRHDGIIERNYQCNSLIYDSNYLCSAAASFSFLCNISLTVVVNSHQMTVALLRRESRNLSVIYVSPTQIARVRGLKNLIKRLHTPLRLLTQYVFLSAYIGMEMDLNINTAERRRAGISSYAAARLDNPLILSAVVTCSDAAAARRETEQRALMPL